MKKTIAFLFATFLCLNSFAGGGKIVFSKSLIDAATGESLISAASFDVGEMVYCHVYLPKAIGKYKSSTTNRNCKDWQALVYIDGKEDPYYTVNSESFNNGEELTIANFGFILSDGKTKLESDNVPDCKAFKKAINDLKPGQHKITVEIWIDDKRAKGEFTLNKTENAKLKFGNSFDDVKAKKSDAKLEAQAIEAINKYLSSYGQTATKVKIVSDWEIGNAPSGVIVSRLIDFAALIKNSDGSCQVWVHRLQQQYNGKGYEDKFMLGVGWVISTGNNYSEYNWKNADCN